MHVNGQGPFDFVIDTGAAMSIVTEELAGIIGLKSEETKEAVGSAGKRIEVPLGTAGLISIGETSVEDVRVGIMKQLPKCVDAQGALGYNFLKGFVLTIDYASNVLTFASPSDHKGPEPSLQTYVPLRLARADRPVLLVDVLVNTQETYQFIVDTGASQTVVSPELARRMSIRETNGDSLIGVGGATSSSVGVLRSLSIGEATLRNVQVISVDIFSALSQAIGTKFDGILGFNFLRKFKLEIDYPHERLRLEKQVHAG